MCRDIKGAYTNYEVLKITNHGDNPYWKEVHLSHGTKLVLPIKGFCEMNLRVGKRVALYTKVLW